MRGVRAVLDRPSHWQRLDPVARTVKRVVDQVLPRRAKDLLQGHPIGHPAHPPMAQLTLVGLVGAGLLAVREMVSRETRVRAGREVLAWSALAAAAPTAWAGWADWADLHEDQQRVGLVHAATMGSAVALCVVGRTRRDDRRSAPWDVAAGVVAGAGSALGGHLAFRWAAGANHAEAFPHLASQDWTRVHRLDDLTEGQPTLVVVGDEPAVLVLLAGTVHSLADRCAHLGGPLHEGDLDTVEGQTCLVCPWHATPFRLSDGEPVHGPAIAPQPTLESRVVEGWVEVRPRRLPMVPGR